MRNQLGRNRLSEGGRDLTERTAMSQIRKLRPGNPLRAEGKEGNRLPASGARGGRRISRLGVPGDEEGGGALFKSRKREGREKEGK